MRLLIIEDEQEIGSYLKANFEKEGFAVDYATTGTQGSYLARTNEYEAIVIDHFLPHKTGMDIVKEVREQQKTVPMIMVSAKGEISHKVDMFRAGADDYVTKPFSFQELLERVKAVTRRPYQIKSSVYHIDDMTIDCDKQEVTQNGKRLYFTRKEFLLLECLAKEKGRVITRGVIMESVWNMNIDPFSNTLETHILNVRKKIGKKGKKLIKTVPGRGYKIET